MAQSSKPLARAPSRPEGLGGALGPRAERTREPQTRVAGNSQIPMLPPMSRAAFEKALQYPLEQTNFAELGTLYRGKVRDNYSSADGVRTIIVSDRISAFDRNVGTLPLKGQMLNHIAAWWFERTK